MAKIYLIPFGCPRAGTTFLDLAVKRIQNVHDVFSLRESWKNHPCKSENGLMHLAHIFRGKTLVYVRIKRHPMQIAAAFEACMSGEVAMSGSLSKNTPKKVVNWIETESVNFHTQNNFMQGTTNPGWRKVDWRVVQVEYEKLNNPAYVNDVAKEIEQKTDGLADVLPFVRFVKERFGKPEGAAIAGRLSSRSDFEMSSEKTAFYLKHLKGAIQREGYER